MVRPKGAVVQVECPGELDDSAFAEVGTSGFEVGRFELERDGIGVGNCVDGPRWLEADMPVGLFVLGEGDVAAYQYPGGGGARTINPMILE
ncbi:MAG: hypothetical protein JXR76_20395 [Deltaproteobacteria bacterium]|nr:hypothetical protein [Deltaproteobacteria bacterium]